MYQPSLNIFSYFLLPQFSLSFFVFFCFTFDTKPFAFSNFFNPHAFNVEPLKCTSFTFTRNKVVLVLTHLHMHHSSCDLSLLVEFVKYLPISSGKRTLQNRGLALLKISAWISVSAQIVSRKVSFSVQTKKSQNLKPVTNNCVWT